MDAMEKFIAQAQIALAKTIVNSLKLEFWMAKGADKAEAYQGQKPDLEVVQKQNI